MSDLTKTSWHIPGKVYILLYNEFNRNSNLIKRVLYFSKSRLMLGLMRELFSYYIVHFGMVGWLTGQQIVDFDNVSIAQLRVGLSFARARHSFFPWMDKYLIGTGG